jgi:ketosteroid isomerase-like protein
MTFAKEAEMTHSFTEADTTAIRALSDVHVRGLLHHDPKEFLSACTDDIMFIPPEGSSISGQTAAHAYLDAFPRLASMSVDVEEVEGSGPIAFSRGSARATLEDGTAVVFKWMEIHRKQADGTWKMARDLWSVGT